MGTLLIVALIFVTLASCSYMRYDAGRPVVSFPIAQRRLDELDAVFDATFTEPNRPVVVYVHGRGREPNKSRKEQILQRIESQHDVEVLMLNWDSKTVVNKLHRPVKDAKAGAAPLRQLIHALARYRARKGVTTPVSLLAHSMGNLVLEWATTKEPDLLRDPQGEPLFTNILMTQSDVDAGPHADWTERLSAKRHILMTLNRDDGTLRFSFHKNNEVPLGRCRPDRHRLAANAAYLDMTGLVGGGHRLFAKGAFEGHVAFAKIVRPMMRGEDPDLAVGSTIDRIEHGRVYVPKDLRDSDERAVDREPDISDDPD